ncbi:V-type proton ATPase subunit c4 [Abeliophyllum distichum]|uniref:V-type proton ATPase proteolipid subunit n=1 Tax=Abeliophyllum distichum TaxID=126358 RepID=A0ABD1RYG8_9LAMI
MGAAYGTAKSGGGVASMGVMRPELVMKSIVPVAMAGVLGIYGLIIAVIISTGINPKAKSYYLFDGYAHLSSGLACGLAGNVVGQQYGFRENGGFMISVLEECGRRERGCWGGFMRSVREECGRRERNLRLLVWKF